MSPAPVVYGCFEEDRSISKGPAGITGGAFVKHFLILVVDSSTFLWYNSLSDRVIHFPVVNYLFRGGMIMNRIQFYPSQALADILNAEAARLKQD